MGWTVPGWAYELVYDSASTCGDCVGTAADEAFAAYLQGRIAMQVGDVEAAIDRLESFFERTARSEKT